MKLDEIVLLEQHQPFDLSIISKNCSEFLGNSDAYSTPLYRGMKGKIRAPGEVSIRSDRRALHTNKLSTALFNLCIELRFKQPAIRSRVGFATTSFQEANGYGNVYYVFPRNGTKVMYNPTFPDSIAIMRRLSDSIMKSFVNSGVSSDKTGPCWKAVEELSNRLDGNVKLDDLDNLPDLCKQILVRALQEEVAYNEYIKGYKHSSIGQMELISQHRGVEYMLYDSPSYYVISRNLLAEIAAEDLGDDAEGLLNVTSSSGHDALYEYLLDLIDDGATL